MLRSILVLLLVSIPLKTHVAPAGKVRKVDPGYLCSICGFYGKWSGDRKRHERKHTGERPHKCRYCFRGFTQSYDRKLHEDRHTPTEISVWAAKALLKKK